MGTKDDLHCPRFFINPLLPSISVQLILCPRYCLSIVVWVCLYFVFFRILYVVNYVEFGQLSFFLHVQGVRVTTKFLRIGRRYLISETNFFLKLSHKCRNFRLHGEPGNTSEPAYYGHGVRGTKSL